MASEAEEQHTHTHTPYFTHSYAEEELGWLRRPGSNSLVTLGKAAVFWGPLYLSHRVRMLAVMRENPVLV